MFCICMERVLCLDMPFNLVAIYMWRIAMDLSGLTRFLHVHVILGVPLETKCDISSTLSPGLTNQRLQ